MDKSKLTKFEQEVVAYYEERAKAANDAALEARPPTPLTGQEQLERQKVDQQKTHSDHHVKQDAPEKHSQAAEEHEEEGAEQAPEEESHSHRAAHRSSQKGSTQKRTKKS